MSKEEKLILSGIEKYDKKDMARNPLLCVEAIGFLEACKIVIPEEADTFDNMIKNYELLLHLLTTVD